MELRRTWFFSLFMIIGLPYAAGATIVDDATLADEAEGDNWLAYGRTYAETRFSPLDQINEDSVNRLGVGWHLDLPTDRSLIGTPLVVDGIL